MSDADVLVTDNGIRCRMDFPDARIIVTAEEVLALPIGTKVGAVFYRVGSERMCPLTAMRVLVRCGVLQEEGLEKRFDG